MGSLTSPPPHAAIHLPFKTLSLRFPSFLSFLSRLHCLSPKFSPLLPLRLLAPVALACTGGPPLQSLPCAATHLPPPIVCFCAKIACGSASACRSLAAQLAFALCHEGLSSTGFRGVFGIILSWRISSITCFCLSPCLFLCVVSSSGVRHSLISLCCLPQAHALPTLAPDAVPSRRTSSRMHFPRGCPCLSRAFAHNLPPPTSAGCPLEPLSSVPPWARRAGPPRKVHGSVSALKVQIMLHRMRLRRQGQAEEERAPPVLEAKDCCSRDDGVLAPRPPPERAEDLRFLRTVIFSAVLPALFRVCRARESAAAPRRAFPSRSSLRVSLASRAALLSAFLFVHINVCLLLSLPFPISSPSLFPCFSPPPSSLPSPSPASPFQRIPLLPNIKVFLEAELGGARPRGGGDHPAELAAFSGHPRR